MSKRFFTSNFQKNIRMRSMFTKALSFGCLVMLLLVSTTSNAQLYWNTNGTLASLTAANWGTVATGPFTTAWTNGSNINFTANSSITNVTNTPVGNLTVTNSSTVAWGVAGTFSTGGGIRTFDIGTGSTLNWNGQSVSTVAGTGFIKNGGGTWNIGAQGNLYPGGFTLNAGMVIIGGINAFGGGGTNPLNINGGTICTVATRTIPAGKYSAINIGGDFTFGDGASNTANISFADPTSLGTAVRKIDLAGTAAVSTYTFGGAISGAGGGITLGTTSGNGILLLTNAANSYTGATTITSGELRLNPATTTATFASPITLNGGTLSTTNIAVNTVLTSSSTLNLSASSAINLGSLVHSLKFANSSAVSWTAGAVLTISGWTGTVSVGASGTAGKIFFGTDATGLTAAQLSQIKFQKAGIYYPAIILSTGEVVPALKYAITSISPASPTATVGFSVTVQSQDYDGIPRLTINGSTFSLSTNGNAGAISGTTTGTILGSTNSVTVSGVILASAGTNVTLTATRTSGDPLITGVSSPFTVLAAGGTPTHFAITSISPASPTAGSGFNVTVESQDGSNVPQSVAANTSFSLSTNGNAGSIGGTVTGTINASTSSVVVTGVTLATAGTGVTLTATRTSGDNLTAGTSAGFTVLAAANHLAFVGVPSTGTVNTNITTFTVEARRPDNTVDNTYTGNVVISKGSGTGTLSGTLTQPAVSGVATFNNLQFNAADTYTLNANSGAFSQITSGNIVISDVSLSTDFFRSNGTGGGTWNTAGTWQTSHDGSTGWMTSTLVPGNTASGINIRTGDVVTVSAAQSAILVTVNGQLTINTGITLTLTNATGFDVTVNGTLLNSGTLTLTGCTMSVTSGGTYIHNTGTSAATLFGLTTLDPNSTTIYRGSGTLTPAVSFSGRTYGHLIFESTSGTWTAAISGSTASSSTNFTLGTGVTLTNTYTGTFTVNGNLSIDGTLTNGAGAQTFSLSGAGKTISGSNLNGFFDVLNINNGASYSLQNNLTSLAAGTINMLGTSTLDINGKILTLGVFTGSATASLSGSATSEVVIAGTAGTLYFTSGSQSLNNLTLNSGSSATLGSALDIYGAITLTTASLNLNAQHLTLKSGLSATGSIGNLTGSTLTGATNVTVERYISDNSGGRAWRMLSAPTTGQTINAAWQEGFWGGTVGISGYGTLITSTVVPSSGNLEDSQQPNSSLGTYSGGAWSWLSSTNVPFATNSGYMIYIRGDRNIAPSTSTTGANATVLRSTGTIHQGTQGAIAASGFTLVGNVYPSTIDFASITKSGINNSFIVWDPALPGSYNLGAYQTWTSGTGWTPGGGNYSGNPAGVIQSGQAFFVSGTGSITLTEASKVSGSRSVFTPMATLPVFRTNLYVSGTPNKLADGNAVVFDNSYSNAIDADDAPKMNNWGENFGMIRNAASLVVESRQALVSNDTIYYNMNNLKQLTYVLEFNPENMPANVLSAYLLDNYLGTSTQIDITAISTVNFTVTSNPASSASNRFKVVFNVDAPLPVTFISLNATQRSAGIQLDWRVANETGLDHYTVERSLNGMNFGNISNNIAATGNALYSWTDVNPNHGVNFYRIKAIDVSGQPKYTNVVKVVIGSPGSISINPNPVVGGKINLQFVNEAAGKYEINLYNSSGQLIFNSTINHIGGSSTQIIKLPSTLGEGVYQAEIGKPDSSKEVQKIVVNN